MANGRSGSYPKILDVRRSWMESLLIMLFGSPKPGRMGGP